MSQPPHLLIVARAGTGKTTTLIEGLKYVKDLGVKIEPSPQQKAIWTSVKKSSEAKTVCFCSFSNTIVDELKARVPSGCEARTLSGLGYKAVRNAFQLLPGNDAINEDRTSNILEQITKKSIRDLRADYPIQTSTTIRLVSLCKLHLYDGTNEDELDDLVQEFELDLNGSREKIYAMIPKILERAKKVNIDRCIDFDDQLWLPVVLKLPVFKFDLLLVDEVQDCNRAQQELAYMLGRRLVLCGDPAQAIYQFAGADSNSMKRMQKTLESTVQGCETLKLTVTRRCAKAIVKAAQHYVPDFQAHEDNPEGEVKTMYRIHQMITGTDMSPGSMGDVMNRMMQKGNFSGEDYSKHVLDGDMILCRNNAPLVSEAFKFIRQGRKAIIRGRNIGDNLLKLVTKLSKRKSDATGILALQMHLTTWAEEETQKEMAKKYPKDSVIQTIQDKKACLEVLCEEASSVEDLKSKIEALFSNKSTTGILLSSIHKAKGLEAKRVFWIKIPIRKGLSPMQMEAERNIAYVATTRAIELLVHVHEPNKSTEA